MPGIPLIRIRRRGTIISFISLQNDHMSDIQYYNTQILVEKISFPEDWGSIDPRKGIQAYKQEAPLQEENLCAHSLFTLFTAEIIVKDQVFIR
jgi:hypothetical protein